MGLIAGVLEDRGISTVCLSTFEAVMAKVRPPRWLSVPYAMGYPLGEPNAPELQKKILGQAFGLLDEDGPGPAMREYRP